MVEYGVSFVSMQIALQDVRPMSFTHMFAASMPKARADLSADEQKVIAVPEVWHDWCNCSAIGADKNQENSPGFSIVTWKVT